MRQSNAEPVLDNTLALGQFVERAQRCGIGWMLAHDIDKVTPEFRYELRIFEGPARAIYRGATATHAASKAQAALDEHRIGWEAPTAPGKSPDPWCGQSCGHTDDQSFDGQFCGSCNPYLGGDWPACTGPEEEGGADA